MKLKEQKHLLDLNREMAGLIAETNNLQAIERAGNAGVASNTVVRNWGSLLLAPAALYGHALAEGMRHRDIPAEMFEREIQMTATKLRLGDRAFVYEALTGQIAWAHQRMRAIELSIEGMDDVRLKIRLMELILRIQAATAKTLATLAGLKVAGY